LGQRKSGLIRQVTT